MGAGYPAGLEKGLDVRSQGVEAGRVRLAKIQATQEDLGFIALSLKPYAEANVTDPSTNHVEAVLSRKVHLLKPVRWVSGFVRALFAIELSHLVAFSAPLNTIWTAMGAFLARLLTIFATSKAPSPGTSTPTRPMSAGPCELTLVAPRCDQRVHPSGLQEHRGLVDARLGSSRLLLQHIFSLLQRLYHNQQLNHR